MKFQKKHKPVTKKFWKFMRFMPPFLRKRMIRKQFEVNYELSSDYVFKQAETVTEIEEALNIVYESYSLLGYIDKRPEKVHFNAYLCLPTTTILIIKYKDDVIGTMSIVPDSAFGLPSETTWNLSKIRSKSKNLAEISSLSIKKSHKSSKGNILLTLCKLMYEYCTETLKLDGIVMAATQEVEPFYTDLLLFEKVVATTGQEHKLVKGNKSTCCFLDLANATATYKKAYEGYPDKNNLHMFFMGSKLPNIQLPLSQKSIHGQHLKKNTAMIQILEKFPALNEMFSVSDKLRIANLDPLCQIERAMNFDTNHTTRVYPRISIKSVRAYLYHANSHSTVRAQIIEVSNQGFGVKSLEQRMDQVKLQESFILLFEMDGEPLSIHSQLRWFKDNDFGFLVLERSRTDWIRFVSHVFNEINLPIDQKREIAIKKVA